MSDSSPLVTVVIPTYNWSSVLSYAIRSVLWQTFQDFELLVIGDGCTDDTEQVVASFDDPRISWFNLPHNTGNQAAPINMGFELARGQYIAYLGHDDLWFPDHLEAMLKTIEETQADLVYSILAMVHPPPSDLVDLIGLGQTDKYDYSACHRPGSTMHRRDLVEAIGTWRHYRSIQLPPDVDFFTRAVLYRRRFASTNALTAIKFSASARPGTYIEKPSHEQAAYVRRIQEDPTLRYDLLMRGLRDSPMRIVGARGRMRMDDDRLVPGAVIAASRARRGLPPSTDPVEVIEHPPVYASKQLLYLINNQVDIAPREPRWALFYEDRLLQDGLLVGMNWTDALYDFWGECYRAAKPGAQIIVTQPGGRRRHLFLDVTVRDNIPLTLTIQNEQGETVAQAHVTRRDVITVEVPLLAGEGTWFSLHARPDAPAAQGEPQPPYLHVYRFGWTDTLPAVSIEYASPVSQQDLDDLLLFRATSIRYYLRRLRQWLRGK